MKWRNYLTSLTLDKNAPCTQYFRKFTVIYPFTKAHKGNEDPQLNNLINLQSACDGEDTSNKWVLIP